VAATAVALCNVQLFCGMEIVCHANQIAAASAAATIANCFGSKICVASSSLSPLLFVF